MYTGVKGTHPLCPLSKYPLHKLKINGLINKHQYASELTTFFFSTGAEEIIVTVNLSRLQTPSETTGQETR